MSSLLYIRLKQVELIFNGDEPPGGPPRQPALDDDSAAQDNLVIATLEYPRPGAPTVTTTKAMDLPSGYKKTFKDDQFWESLLFKESVCGETVLEVAVSDRDNRSIFLKMVGLVIGGILGASVAGVTNVVLGGIASGTSEPLLDVVKNMGGKDNTKVMGKSRKIAIRTSGETITVDAPGSIWDRDKSELTLPLEAPEDLHYLDLHDPKRERRVILNKGANNGQVVLSLKILAESAVNLPA